MQKRMLPGLNSSVSAWPPCKACPQPRSRRRVEPEASQRLLCRNGDENLVGSGQRTISEPRDVGANLVFAHSVIDATQCGPSRAITRSLPTIDAAHCLCWKHRRSPHHGSRATSRSINSSTDYADWTYIICEICCVAGVSEANIEAGGVGRTPRSGYGVSPLLIVCGS